MKHQYGMKRRSDGKIIRHTIADIRHQQRTTNLSYVFGEIYRREPGGEWEYYGYRV